MFLVISTMMQFAYYATPFCQSMYGMNVLLSYVIIFKQEWFNALETNSPMLPTKSLDFVLRLYFYERLEHLELLKTFIFGFQRIKLHFFWEIIYGSLEVPCTTHGCVPYEAPHVGKQNFQRFGHSLLYPSFGNATLYYLFSIQIS